VYAAVAQHGGSVSAEHGLGQLRRELAHRLRPSVENEMMQSIKRAMDPQGLMNPGKLLWT
jgi:FAD/FMN-containing dehydrogenase